MMSGGCALKVGKPCSLGDFVSQARVSWWTGGEGRAIELGLCSEAEAATVHFVSLETFGILIPLSLTHTPLEVVVLLEEPNRGPTIPIEVGLILGMERTQQFHIVVTNVIVIDRNLIEAKVGQLVGIVNLTWLEQSEYDRVDVRVHLHLNELRDDSLLHQRN